MNIYYKKYRTLTGREVCKMFEDFLANNDNPLTDKQLRLLYDYWGEYLGNNGNLGLPFQAYNWKSVKYKGNTGLRLTFPFFVIYVIILTCIIRPIHWLFTGSWWFKENHWIEELTKKWDTNIFGE